MNIVIHILSIIMGHMRIMGVNTGIIIGLIMNVIRYII